MIGKFHFSGYTAGRDAVIRKTGPDSIGHCNRHDKTSWSSRKAARRACKKRHPEGGKSPYRCFYTNAWHYGSLNYSRDAYRGVVDAEEDAGREVDPQGDEHEQSGERSGPAEA